MASLIWWTWVWVNFGSWWWTGRPGVLWFMGSQRVGHDWETELNWTEYTNDCRSSVTSVSLTFNSSQFSWPADSDSLRTCGLQHTWLPCPSPTPRACSNSCPWVSDAIQPTHPLSSPFPPAFSLSQYQGLFQWVSSLHQVAKVLEFQLQHQFFQWIPSTDLL